MTQDQHPQIPLQLISVPRWITWTRKGGNKIPDTKINDVKGWMTYEQAKLRIPFGGGLGIIFSSDDDLGGIDLDACRDPETGTLTTWAIELINDFDSYTEISPSGTGVKIFAFGAPKSLPSHVIKMPGKMLGKKKPQIEAYVADRYFCVTGLHLEDTPMLVKDAKKAWAKLIMMLSGHGQQNAPPDTDGKVESGSRNVTLASMAGSMRRRGFDEDAILAALEIYNKKNCDPPLSAQELASIIASVGKYDPTSVGWVKNDKGQVYPNLMSNIELAFTKMGVDIRYNAFTDRIIIDTGGGTYQVAEDHLAKKLWFDIREKFGFQPAKEVLFDAIEVIARENTFHPVMDYFSNLQWDGAPRIDKWLTTYTGAEETEYTKAVGALVLVAAVRRIKSPGCKFDEMLVFETPLQGTDKSSGIAALCPDHDWFSDNLKLNTDSKEVIERTSGKWIIEAAELSGMRKTDVEHLKSFLSRQVDEARLAWGKLTAIRPRQFIIMGTTNNNLYLRDMTGNRRFWPVKIRQFLVKEIRKDRDQLWAEAVHREATGASIRLDQKLWASAEVEQNSRLLSDPWQDRLEETLRGLTGKIVCSDVWDLLEINEVWRRDQQGATRISAIMQKLGFEHKRARVEGKPRWCYARGESWEHENNWIKVTLDDFGKMTTTLDQIKKPIPEAQEPEPKG